MEVKSTFEHYLPLSLSLSGDSHLLEIYKSSG